MPIIFSDANAYQDDLGPSEGEMFFTNLLSGLQKGVEEGGRRKYAQELRQQELADRLAAEQRQQGYLTASEQRQQGYIKDSEQRVQGYLAASEKRQETRQLASEKRQMVNARKLADEASEREQKKWEKRGGKVDVESKELQLKEDRRKAQQAATEASQQTMAESAMGDLAGLSTGPEGVPDALGYIDIDARVQAASEEIAKRAQTIEDPVARNRFMDQASARLDNQLQRLKEQQRVKQQVEEQRRAEEDRLIDAEVAAAHIDSGGRFIPQDDKDFVVQGLSNRETALNSLYKAGRLTPVKWSEEVGKLLSQYQKYESDRQQRQAEAFRAWLKSQGGGAATDDMSFEGAMGVLPGNTAVPGAMGNAPVRLFPSGTQLPAGNAVNAAEAWLGSQQ